ncbi:IS21 family transposase, partial [Verminephrobacter eiseniae]|nr:IS21 family transposase [Verminephrobacter eiseniae]MCW8225643.1 IS21 family transposase [Verminephrobacter eiseniae]MCW8225904.1 IS21 family transposase [Verminephrobacter eiseniae]MCW8235848.1 IS21 family transposase [Verminephrobacter eiseniae]MCW8236817.1 IS21 family transposase [Verminephrobacter eiseniae]
MRQIRQVLRLHLDAGLPYAKVARALGLPKSTVGKFALLARAAGVDWAVAQTLTDQELEARLYRSAVPRAAHHLEPNYALIHQELKRPGV